MYKQVIVQLSARKVSISQLNSMLGILSLFKEQMECEEIVVAGFSKDFCWLSLLA